MPKFYRWLCISLVASSCSLISGCPHPANNAVATVTYSQIGSCANFSNLQGAGPNLAFVFFRFTQVDDTQPATDYNFNPQTLYINDTGAGMFVAAQTNGWASTLGYTAVVPVNVPHGTSKALNNVGAFLVSTADADGAKESSQTNYFLLNHTNPGTPGVLLVKSNYNQTQYPYTPSCSQIQFPR